MRLHLACLDWPEPEKEYQLEFSQVEGQTFSGRVHVDNRQYKNCRFVNCTFVYSGGPFGFADCQVEGDFLLGLTGAAYRSLEFWQQFEEYGRTRMPPC